MTCARCQGFMIVDHLLDLEGAFGEMWATSWRCMNCGHVHDNVTEQNRLPRPKPVVVGPSGEPDGHNDGQRGAASALKHAA